MKNLRKLIPTICMFLLAACLFGTSTFAWFSMNKTVTVTGMTVKATTAESLVIGTGLNVGTAVTVDMSSSITTLTPATHDGSSGTYLSYVTNSGDVDAATGFATSGATLVTSSAVNDSTKSLYYYIDYVVYVAASGKEMTGKTLTVTFDDASKAALAGLTDVTNDTVKAFTADVFYETVSAVSDGATGTYLGKLAFADAATASLTTGTLAIPLNTTTSGNKAIKFCFRVYLDGALEKSSGQAYVYNDVIDVTETTLGFAITVNDAT